MAKKTRIALYKKELKLEDKQFEKFRALLKNMQDDVKKQSNADTKKDVRKKHHKEIEKFLGEKKFKSFKSVNKKLRAESK